MLLRLLVFFGVLAAFVVALTLLTNRSFGPLGTLTLIVVVALVWFLGIEGGVLP